MNPIGDRYGQLVQMSYITRDMDAAVAHAVAELGITGLSRGEAEIEVLSYGEKRPLAVKSAIANFGTRQFEIIQPVSGAIEVYTDAMDLSGHILNFHHVGIAVTGPWTEWQRLLNDVKASGDAFTYLFPAEPSPEDKLCFCYVDTRHRIGIPAAPWLEA